MKKWMFVVGCLLLAGCAGVSSQPSPTVADPTQTPVPVTSTGIPRSPTPVLTRVLTRTPSATPGPVLRTPTRLPALRAGQPVTITQLYQMNASFGWGLEPAGHLLRTANEGETWRDVSPPAGFIFAPGFFPLTAKTAWVVPVSHCPTDQRICNPAQAQAVVWHTVDGGKTWQAGQPVVLDDAGRVLPLSPSLYFLDAKNGWLLAELYRGPAAPTALRKLFRTTDGGASWQLIADNEGLPSSGSGLVFVDAQTGWMGASSSSDDTPPLYRTLDGGRTWAAHPFATLTVSAEYRPCRTRPVYIFWHAVGINVLCMERPIPFYTWTSGVGQVWRAWRASGNEFFLDTERGWRMFLPSAGRAHLLQRTIDGGQHWETLRTVGWESVQLDFTDDNLGWGVVRNGQSVFLVHTSDGGRDWVQFEPVVVDR